MFCENSIQARVWFQYPDKEWDNIVTRNVGVDYELEEIFEKGKCKDVRYDVVIGYQEYWYIAGIDECRTREGNDFTVRVWGEIGNIISDVETNPATIYPCANRRTYKYIYLESRSPYSRPFIYQRYVIYQNADACFNFRIKSIRRVDGLEDNCGKYRCQFKVMDKGGVIYNRTEDVCPTVYIQCDNDCPPGFCKCERYPGDPNWCCCPCNCGGK